MDLRNCQKRRKIITRVCQGRFNDQTFKENVELHRRKAQTHFHGLSYCRSEDVKLED